MSEVKKKLLDRAPAVESVKRMEFIELLKGIRQTLDHFVGDWRALFNSMPDYRSSRADYDMAEVVLAAVMMFILRQGSRHQMDQDRSSGEFAKNYQYLFGCRLPHMDTVSDVLKQLPPELLEQIRCQIIKFILSKRVLHKYRLESTYFCVAIDGTGVYTFKEEPYPNCPFRTSKSGKKLYYQNVLEAKIVCENGFCLSIGTEWLRNEDGKEKQDCELNAMKRLVKTIKSEYPRLPICLLLDGLYANGPAMQLIKKRGWEFIIVWKDACLTSVWEQLAEVKFEGKTKAIEKEDILNKSSIRNRVYCYSLEALKYSDVSIYSVEMDTETIDLKSKKSDDTHRFVFLTSIALDEQNIEAITQAGRMRWRIENEGFNHQKNNGMELHHKYVRGNQNGIHNFYLIMQLAHIFEQLIELCQNKFIQGKLTWRSMWRFAWAYLFAIPLRLLSTCKYIKPNQLNYRY